MKPLHSVIASARLTSSLSIESHGWSIVPQVAVPPTQSLNVAVFWDLDNKQPKDIPPYDAAIKLKKAASSFGFARYLIAYANRHAFGYVPQVVLQQRKERKLMDQMESRGVIRPKDAYLCRVCGRRFYFREKLVNHFKQIHERENEKRVRQIDAARGSKRVELVGKYSMQMDKYKNAARDLLTPKVGYGLADELKRAGFWVKTVSDKPQAADIALREDMVDMMDRNKAKCLVLVSDDSDFVDVLKEARERCLKTVVVGDMGDGALKRVADASFSWQEVLMGKAKKEAVSVVGRWKDRDILKRLEWTYNPEVDGDFYDVDDDSEEENIEQTVDRVDDEDFIKKESSIPWWKLDSDDDITTSQLDSKGDCYDASSKTFQKERKLSAKLSICVN